MPPWSRREALQEVFKRLDGQRTTEQETLITVTAMAVEELALRFVLDAFRNHLEPETAPHSDDGLRDDRVTPVLGESADKSTVDLELVEG